MPAGRPSLGVVLDPRRRRDGQLAALVAARGAAQTADAGLRVALLEGGAPADVEALAWAARGDDIELVPCADDQGALVVLRPCDAVLALHPEAQTPPALLACVGGGLPVVAFADAEADELLVAAIPTGGTGRPDPGALEAAVAALLADRAGAVALGAERAARLVATRSPEAIGALVAARLEELTAEGAIPVGPRERPPAAVGT